MRSIKQALADMDFVTLGATLALVVMGILSVYSSGVTAEGVLVSKEYIKQIVWAVSGLGLMAAVAFLDYKRIKDYSFIVYLVLVALLVYTRLFGKVVNGARSWLGLVGDMGIQPSEFMKVATILLLAQYLSESEHESSLRRLGLSFAIILLPLGLILSQPDFGTALVFFPIFVFMIFVAGLDRRYIVFIIAFGSATSLLTVLPLWEKYMLRSPTSFLFVLYREPYPYILMAAALLVLGLSAWGWVSFKKGYYFWIAYVAIVLAGSLGASILAHKVLKDYQVMRLIVFLDPSIDPRGSGWNILQSITAIGSGGIAGKGFLQGTQSHYRYLPQQSTDFIFSIIAEEWGFLGGFAVFSLFFVLMRRCVLLLRTAKDRYAEYIVAGIMGM
ncbi:MAG TPA: rod shape-determining protein RodA, partial [Spirochaetia bacterium]|nr:rod shape-determining protein RodA [Spirochaetia bacterium]